jgi:hypothetical protein
LKKETSKMGKLRGGLAKWVKAHGGKGKAHCLAASMKKRGGGRRKKTK